MYSEQQKKSLEAVDKYLKETPPEEVEALKKQYGVGYFMPNLALISSFVTSLMVILYVTIGGGLSLYNGFKMHHVEGGLALIGFSALIFVSRIVNAYFHRAYSTVYADLYGMVVFLLLTVLKFVYN